MSRDSLFCTHQDYPLSPRQGEGIPHSGNIREEAMPIGHSPCIWHTELGCIALISWNYRFADDQQQGRLLDCGRCEIASPDGT